MKLHIGAHYKDMTAASAFLVSTKNKRKEKTDVQMFPTIFVLNVWPRSTSEQFLGTLLLATVGSRVQRGVSQQVRAVDVWRLFPAELR